MPEVKRYGDLFHFKQTGHFPSPVALKLKGSVSAFASLMGSVGAAEAGLTCALPSGVLAHLYISLPLFFFFLFVKKKTTAARGSARESHPGDTGGSSMFQPEFSTADFYLWPCFSVTEK